MKTITKPGLKVIITGATGMVGEGVLHECLINPAIRKSYGLAHPKLKEIVHADFHNISPVAEQLKSYDACFFCAGVSSVGKKEEEEFYHLTYTLTMHVAAVLAKQNPNMTFCYVSGAGTDSSEKGRMMWARVKGKTENDLTKLPFAQVYNFRPGFIIAGKGMKNTLPYYKYFAWMVPVIKTIAPNMIVRLSDIGLAMINAVTKGYKKSILEVKDIKELAAQ